MRKVLIIYKTHKKIKHNQPFEVKFDERYTCWRNNLLLLSWLLLLWLLLLLFLFCFCFCCCYDRKKKCSKASGVRIFNEKFVFNGLISRKTISKWPKLLEKKSLLISSCHQGTQNLKGLPSFPEDSPSKKSASTMNSHNFPTQWKPRRVS